ncbi:MAG: hypothetical protein GXO43_09155 [Crenarchaeota archaeon]|nr:hypothetical protein [Thermoproteota archaeon]
MAIVVKRVKGKLYVYDQYRVNGRVKTFYIDPLEEMARIYQIYQAGSETPNENPSRRIHETYQCS